MTQVARAFGPSFDHVWRQPYHMTLLAFCGLLERQRIEGLIEYSRDVAQACRINAAFAAPKELSKEQRDARRALKRPPGAQNGAGVNKADAVAMAQAAVALVTRQESA